MKAAKRQYLNFDRPHGHFNQTEILDRPHGHFNQTGEKGHLNLI